MRKRGSPVESETSFCIVVMRSMGRPRSSSAAACRSGAAMRSGSIRVRNRIVGRASMFETLLHRETFLRASGQF